LTALDSQPSTLNSQLRALALRTVEIDYLHGHRHLPSSLSALPIIAEIYAEMTDRDVFILSKGHACAAHYAVLEHHGYRPDVSKVHPERDPANGIHMTAGSRGHGYPTAVGLALAKKFQHSGSVEPKPGIPWGGGTGYVGRVHVLLGDGECQEGTNFEAAHLAARWDLSRWLTVHVDCNGWQGSDTIRSCAARQLGQIFPVKYHLTKKGYGVRMFEQHPEKSTHTVTAEDYAAIMAELS